MQNPIRHALEERYISLLSYSVILEGSETIANIKTDLQKVQSDYAEAVVDIQRGIIQLAMMTFVLGACAQIPSLSWVILGVCVICGIFAIVVVRQMSADFAFLKAAYSNRQSMQDLLIQEITMLRDLCKAKQISLNNLAVDILPYVSSETLVTLIASQEDLYTSLKREVPTRADILNPFFERAKKPLD